MSREAHSMNLQKNAGAEETFEVRKVDVRYLGQGHELTIPINPGKLSTKDVEDLREKFEELYHQIYGLNLPELVKVYNRSDLSAGQSIHGLCVIQEPETTVIVPQGFIGWMNPFGHIILEDQNKKSIDV